MRGCCFCGFSEETVALVIILCWWVRAFWSSLNILNENEDAEIGVADWLWKLTKEKDMKMLRKILIGVWVLWKNRNRILHEGGELRAAM